jgi:hypothetical protein
LELFERKIKEEEEEEKVKRNDTITSESKSPGRKRFGSHVHGN